MLNAAFKNAAPSAKPTAINATVAEPINVAANATAANKNPTSWANRRGAESSSSPGSPKRGRTNFR